MAVFRVAIFLLLFASGLSFLLYAITSQLRYKRTGLAILKWTVVAALVFFAVLIADRLI